MVTRIKICGITSLADALVAVEAGAGAVGFVFVTTSPRCVTAETAAKIGRAIPPFVARVGVFADAAIARVQQTVEEGDLDTVQLHGGETPGFCRQLQGVRRIKAFRIRGAADLDRLRDYNTDAWLLDSFVEGELGGTGRTFNWDLARRATELGLPVVLAGGLNPENVAEAIRTVRPFAVDVSSGVESRPGVKDPVKVRAFVEAVKSADTAPAQT